MLSIATVKCFCVAKRQASFSIFSTLSLAILLSGCHASSKPDVTELFSLSPPTFDGKQEQTITIPSQNFTLRGECDKNSHDIEYSLDDGPFISLNVACPSGVFSVPVTVPLTLDVRVRAKGKNDYTTISVAHLRFVAVTTSPMFTFVQSSSSDSSDLTGRGTQNTMGLSFGGNSLSSSRFKMQTTLPGMTYEK